MEGGFNRVFMVHLDNSKTVVARLPTRLAGPPKLTVSSEVATLQFVSERTSLPVPTVISWSSESNNAIGAEYIIMDAMPGVPLTDVWNNMTASQHIRCIQSLGFLCVQLWEIRFPSYGALYLSADSPPGAVPLDSTFSIGPLVKPHLWAPWALEPSDVNTSRGTLGPWHNLEAYLLDFLSRTVLPTSTENPSVSTESDHFHHSKELHSAEAHAALLENVRNTLNVVIETDAVKDASNPTLFHPDLHTRNMFVDPEDPTKITGFIDWQSAAIEPSFMITAETPDFGQELPHQSSEEQIKASETEDKTESNQLSPQAKLRADAEFCANAWTVILLICSKVEAAHNLDKMLVHLLAAGSVGWMKDPVVIRRILIELGEEWGSLQLPGQSLYQPAKDEASELERQYETMKETQRLRQHLACLLGCQMDGWVPAEKWDEVLPVYRREFRRFMDTFLEGEETDEGKAKNAQEANSYWPFDQR